ncbi:sigma-70 family RNA polymerase sigma factor [Candidatus Daviesbacteria bacterium]|nr:sigma-70 family RNA polymerase sigma factor [Candidatus Daviesbacteria bacterium]
MEKITQVPEENIPLDDPMIQLRRDLVSTGVGFLSREQQRELVSTQHSGRLAALILNWTGVFLPEDIRTGLLWGVSEGQAARETLALSCVRLVIDRARSLSTRRDMPFPDCVQDGACGLVKAVDDLDPDKGSLTTYAHPRIERAIERGYDTGGRVVRIPPNASQDLQHANRLAAELLGEGIRLTPAELVERIASEGGEGYSTTKAALEWQNNPLLSLTSPVNPFETDGDRLVDMVAGDHSTVDEAFAHLRQGSLEEKTQAMLATLKHRHADMLRRRFGIAPYEEAQGFVEIAKAHNTSYKRVTQIIIEAINGIRLSPTERRRFAEELAEG